MPNPTQFRLLFDKSNKHRDDRYCKIGHSMERSHDNCLGLYHDCAKKGWCKCLQHLHDQNNIILSTTSSNIILLFHYYIITAVTASLSFYFITACVIICQTLNPIHHVDAVVETSYFTSRLTVQHSC